MAEPLSKLIRIFIIDPYALISAGLRLVIEREPGLDVVGCAGESTTGLEMISRLQPEIVLLKLNSCGDPGLEVVPKILEACSHARIILMTIADDFETCTRAVKMGVLGVVPMSQTPQTFIKAIRKVKEGEVWIERSMMARLLKATLPAARGPASVDKVIERIGQLSEREREVIHFIGLGLKNKHIATQMCISEVTVRHHLTSIYGKLGVSDRLELLVFAHRSGLTTPDETKVK
jgi:two-component system, NarL family, nitrate/nitrite response regulator NarL